MTVAAAYLGGSWRLPIQLGALYCLFTIYIYQLEEPKIKVMFVVEGEAGLMRVCVSEDSTHYRHVEIFPRSNGIICCYSGRCQSDSLQADP